MPIFVDHQLQEQIPRNIFDFPIAFYCDELADLPNRAGPMHWHPCFEIAHSAKTVSWTTKWDKPIQFWNRETASLSTKICSTESDRYPAWSPDHLPIIIFSGTVIASENSVIYQKYIQPISSCDSLPCVVFRHDNGLWKDVRQRINATYRAMRDQSDCYELVVQRNICHVLEAIFRNFDSLPKSEASRVQLNTQVRLQKMLSYIYENYARTVTLADIAGAANISRSEAGRCFQSYLGYSPVETLIHYRLQAAQRCCSKPH